MRSIYIMIWASFLPLSSLGQTPKLKHSWGCDQCEGPALLSEVLDVGVTADGTVLVVDGDAPFLRWFGHDGTSGATGQKGKGPGEFSRPVTLSIGKDGTRYVVDSTGFQMVRMDASENVLSHLKTPGFPLQGDIHPLDDTFYLVTLDFRKGASSIYRLAEEQWIEIPMRWDFFEDDTQKPMYFAFAAKQENGFLIGEGGKVYLSHGFSKSGTPDRTWRRAIPAVLKTKAEMAEEEDSFNQFRNRSGVQVKPKIQERKRHFYMFSHSFDDSGNLWILAGRSRNQAAIFDIFDVSGTFLHEIALTVPIDRFAINGKWLAGSGTDAQGIPRVYLWQIESGPPTSE